MIADRSLQEPPRAAAQRGRERIVPRLWGIPVSPGLWRRLADLRGRSGLACLNPRTRRSRHEPSAQADIALSEPRIHSPPRPRAIQRPVSTSPMNPTDIAHTRLHNQRLADNPLGAPVDVVR